MDEPAAGAADALGPAGVGPGGTDTPSSGAPGPPNRLARNLVVATLIAFVVASNLGNLFFSVLVTDHPAIFIALNPSNRNLALASGDVAAPAFYLIGFLRLVGPDPLFFLLGRWYGDAAIAWMERKAPAYGQLLRQLEQWFDKARLPVVAFAPNNPICLFAGAAGMSVGAFVGANVIGTIARLVLIRLFSSVFEGPLGSLRGFIGHYRWPLLVVSFVAVGFTLWSDRRGGRDGIGDLTHIDRDLPADAHADADPGVEADEAAESER
ncbi:MAG: DedA family protein [Acidimicrobiales bacterium]